MRMSKPTLTPLSWILSRIAMAGMVLAIVALNGGTSARTCKTGEQACPAVLHMAKGATAITARGTVSGTHPNYYFKFAARAGQKLTIHTVGRNLKTGPGIPITLPNGSSDAVDENTPYPLPATGSYVIDILANTMSDGPFGPFTVTLTIK
jgi:hypothetical protein